MKKSWLMSTVLLFSLGVSSVGQKTVHAENSRQTDGHITFTGDYDDEGIQDPEHPENETDPGESPGTSGKLRIDFVPQFNFTGHNKISDTDTVYPVNAQLFHDETAARGNFIQVSDYRGAALGWTLQVRQEMQFQNANTANSQLNGAVLSLDKSWTNSTQDKAAAPTVSKEVIRLDNIGATYNLAEAASGKGYGTWSISFGASNDNPLGLDSTLTPKVDAESQPMLDSSFGNKQMQENSAITLSVPGATKKDPVTYSTVLTWILAELP
ncbi:WxL domain-containing protein [Enterococcus sp. BWB1-3]|uniref:WxL domain-containing protein n=1 Tax=unclassified Enterococcus TaxID=2608891 RepID=UPI0019227825|nr:MULTISPECIES: WxL domain-containing protein [unclassified Enterococcus]MBL1229911.1 WxL domain-containing protein [Enterococcus sp. BWB1-3]MCB5951427.1 WxL domain-containing protein [Enterococcus sp. BWT-B8]MCB5954986.1 WxL domain-containing protein [Enterococcus sp. CWB-B31]